MGGCSVGNGADVRASLSQTLKLGPRVRVLVVLVDEVVGGSAGRDAVMVGAAVVAAAAAAERVAGRVGRGRRGVGRRQRLLMLRRQRRRRQAVDL